MNKTVIVDSIVNQLQSDFDSVSLPFTARRLPDSSSDYDKGLKNPICYVILTGSKGINSIGTSPIVQERKLRINIECHGRLLYGASGIDLVTDILEQSLIGFRPERCTKALTLLQDDLTSEEGVWIHVYQLECEVMLLQKNESDHIVVPEFKGLVNEE